MDTPLDLATAYRLRRTEYGTWMIQKRIGGDRMYETTNKLKAEAVLEYLKSQE